MKTYPLSHSQTGIVLACGRHPEDTSYNLPSAIPFPKEVETGRLVLAVKEIVRCRPVLRTRLVISEGGIPLQYADEEMEIPVPCHRMTESEVLNHIHNGFVRPFILFGPHPLCRFEVVETEAHHWLLSDFHHVIADGITIAHCFMGRDLPAAYEGFGDDGKHSCHDDAGKHSCLGDAGKRRPLNGLLEESDILLYDQAEEEEQQTSTSIYQASKAYYHEMFSDVEFTALPSTSIIPSDSGVIVSEKVSRAPVDAWCEAHHATPNQLLMGAFCIVLSKLCHTPRVAFATLTHGRSRKYREAYGMFVKTFPMVSELDAETSVLNYVHSLRPLLTASMRHSAYPYTHFCRDLHKSAEATFAFQGNDILERVTVGGASAVGLQLRKGVAGSGLGCVVYASEQAYEIRVDANASNHGQATLEMFARCMTRCIHQMLQHPHLPLKDVELTDETERAAIIRLSQGEQVPYNTDKTFLDLWLEQVQRRPDAVAVSDGKETMTYAQLERATSDVAHWLADQGVGRGDFIGVTAVPCCGFLTAVIGIMRCRAAYLPLDPFWPEAYRESIVATANLKATLNPTLLPHPDTDDKAEVSVPRPDDTAYMIFTSGTTGSAKGVMLPHRALTNLLHFIVRRWHLDETSRISCHSSLAFDASVEDLFPVLTVGGTVYLMPEVVRHDMEKLHLFLDDNHITGGCYTTQMGAFIANRPHPSLDYICLGGERLMEVPAATCHIYNTYGPTECCVDATYYELEQGRTYATIPIGRPLDNTAAYVVDHHGRLLPQGAVGELCLSGPQLATGYWKDPELTRERFTSRETTRNSRTSRNSRKTSDLLYHTGDLARWNEEWQLEYIGRLDHLVKVNGYRVSLDEVERHIALLPNVTSVCVVVVSHQGRDQLCAYYTSEQAMDAKVLMLALREKIPSYMVPTCWMWRERLPLLSNGKTDRKHLPKPEFSPSHPSAIPLTRLQRVVCNAFCQVLQCGTVGVDDDFFVLGGSSLTAMNLMTVLGEAGCKVEYGWVFQHPTPRLLAQEMTREQADNLYPIEGLSNYGGDGVNGSNGVNGINGRDGEGGLLLTGGTGFLGIHVLHEYLEREEGDVCCLVRGSTAAIARQRLLDTYAYYFGDSPTEERQQRLDVVAGDLTDADALTPLQGRDFSKVINCAADVRHFARPSLLRAVNTEAVARLATFCHNHHALLVQVSTLGIAGFHDALSEEASTLTERDLYIGQILEDPYTHSKYLAERLVLESVGNGALDARIIRVGHLSPRSSDGRFQHNVETNSLAMALRLCTLLRMVPASAADLRVSLIPVDIAAKAVLLLDGLSMGEMGRMGEMGLMGGVVFHLARPNAPTFLELLQRRCPSDPICPSDPFCPSDPLVPSAPSSIRVVDDPVFLKAVEKASADDTMRTMALSAVAHLSVAAGHRPNLIDCSYSAEVLRQLGLRL